MSKPETDDAGKAEAERNRRALARTAVAAFGADANPHLFVALAEHAPERELQFLKADLVRWMLGQAPVPGWVTAVLPDVAAAAATTLRARALTLDEFAPKPEAASWLGDVQTPDWGSAGRIHDWRNHVSPVLQEAWPTFTPLQRVLLANEAEARSAAEEHE